MILEVCWDGLLDTSFGLSQSHGHGSWLVFKVALSLPMARIESSHQPKRLHVHAHSSGFAKWVKYSSVVVT